MNDRVTRTAGEREVIFSGLCERTVTEGVAAALAYRTVNVRNRDVLHRQVQDVLYAVIALSVLDNHYVASGLGVGSTVPFPYVRCRSDLVGTENNRLFRTSYFALSYNDIDTVTTACRGVADRVCLTVIREVVTTVSAREVGEGDALAEQVGRMNGEVQYIE